MLKTKQLVLCALFCALTIIFAQFVIPATPVQFSLSIVPVLLCGFMLTAKYAFFTQIAYLLLAMAGMPVLGKFMGGPGALFGPTGGYILSYPIMAFVCSVISHKLNSKNPIVNFVCQIPSLMLCYVFGTAYLAISTNISFLAAFFQGVVPFLFFDVAKLALCAVCITILTKHKIKF